MASPVAIGLVWAAVVTGCASSTQITGTWKSPDATTANYNRIIVAALTDNPVARQTIEAQLQTQLQQQGIQAARSIDLFPPALMRDGKTTADAILDKIKGNGHDAILTVALVNTETETRYVPGSTMYTPVTRFAWYGTFRGYYTYLYPTMYNPGYYREDKVYFLETNLYDATSERLLWSAQSESYSPSSLQSFSEKFAELTVSRMQKDNLIKGTGASASR
ncbi:hypothetical protein EFA69_11695 [Rufibacter immobilis]|uniref:DUF4136 domain-containing protein n=1 Tax=Rufibacter immobilis TaxID=1348778 RepID=A0A3M9MZ46_9BACT|nr:hypothetical protein EFA69_11695 [Rufibacter immobilis]